MEAVFFTDSPAIVFIVLCWYQCHLSAQEARSRLALIHETEAAAPYDA
jgi:hypothetical protein